MPDKRVSGLFDFMEDTIRYFLEKAEGVEKDRYFADRDTRNILDKSINDIILCMIDIAEECLRKHKRRIPETYRETILACHEFVGDVVLRVSPLVKHRNEAIHQYLKVNWHNIIVVKSKIKDVRWFVSAVKRIV